MNIIIYGKNIVEEKVFRDVKVATCPNPFHEGKIKSQLDCNCSTKASFIYKDEETNKLRQLTFNRDKVQAYSVEYPEEMDS